MNNRDFYPAQYGAFSSGTAESSFTQDDITKVCGEAPPDCSKKNGMDLTTCKIKKAIYDSCVLTVTTELNSTSNTDNGSGQTTPSPVDPSSLTCQQMMDNYQIVPNSTWGTAPKEVILKWLTQRCFAPVSPTASDSSPSGDASNTTGGSQSNKSVFITVGIIILIIIITLVIVIRRRHKLKPSS